MKITFPLPTDNASHHYCLQCHADGVRRVEVDGLTKFTCPSCHALADRYIHIGNTPHDGKWWVDEKGDLWGETACVFVRNPEGKYLFFERITFPLGYTVPAGHVDNAETGGEAAARRELQEEVGITARHLKFVVKTDIIGDCCVGGADAHVWWIYREDLDHTIDVEVLEKEEGKKPIWLTLAEARAKELPFAIRYILEHFSDQIEAAD